MITPVDELIDKVGILDKHLGDDDNKEYKNCCFIHEKIKANLAANKKRRRRKKKKKRGRRRTTLQFATARSSTIAIFSDCWC